MRHSFFHPSLALRGIAGCLLASLLAATGAPVAAQALGSTAELRRATDQVMELVGKGDLEAGLKLLRPRSTIPEGEFDAMEAQTRLQQPVMTQRFGDKIGTEFLREERVGDSLVRLTYLDKFERRAMRWVFYAYKGRQGWMIDNFRFDDQVLLLFP